MGLMYITAIGITFIVEYYRNKIYKKNKFATKKKHDKTHTLVGEIIKSEKDVKALGLENKLSKITYDSFNELRKANTKQESTDCSFWNTRCLILELFGLIILIVGLKMMQENLLTLAIYVLLFSYRDSLYSLVWYFGAISKCFAEVQIGCKRMFSMFDEKNYAIEKFGNKNLETINGKIEFENIEFAYSELEEIENGKTKETKRIKKDPIFKELSFVIEPNTTVAFVGKSGSGKSSILGLISKLIEADKGAVKIDDVDIKELTKQTLRNNISLINQFPYIFDMSIKDNLLLVKQSATDEEIWQALEQASFAETVKLMPKNIETKVGETGVKLSGGQRQRLAIARALLKQTKIILFDESTSSLDNFAQSNIQQSIDSIKGKHTIVIVAHRLSTIRNVDKIYFLDNGQIVDSGTFNQLFNNNAQFKQMFLMENIKN